MVPKGHISGELPGRTPVTISSVAAAAGVSKTTVSHVLTGKRPVSAATRQRVLRVIDELGFEPNVAARMLKTNESHTVGLIVPDIANPYFSAVARGLNETMIKRGYFTFVSQSGSSAETERALLTESVRRRVDAIVISAFGLTSEEFEQLPLAGTPVIGIGTQLFARNLDIVSADDYRMGYDGGRFLHAAGHTRIGTIRGLRSSAAASKRLAGFLAAAEENQVDVPPEYIGLGDSSRDSGYLAAQRLLSLETPPTALYVQNDLMAIGALDVARERSLAVPADIAILGNDDIEVASLISPRLTTIRIPATEIGRAAGTLALTHIEGTAPSRQRSVLIGHELIRRETV